MVKTSNIRAVLFAKNHEQVAAFYSSVLGIKPGAQDEHHTSLQHGEFELIIHQIPNHIAAEIEIADPPVRREAGAIRLDYPIEDVESSRKLARSLGGEIDKAPPPWAEKDTDFYLGYDPEGNVFGVEADQEK
jgi:predicted enzyme related to lactoylglutathione lyase